MKHISLSIILFIILGCYSKQYEKTGLEGNTIPSFKLLLPDSSTYVDTKDIQSGQSIVLFYYGPYCPYSRAQMEEILDEMNSFKETRVYVITSFPFQDMTKFHSQYHLANYPNIVTGFDYTRFLSNYFKITGVPFIAVYDKDKKLNIAFRGKVPTSAIIESFKP